MLLPVGWSNPWAGHGYLMFRVCFVVQCGLGKETGKLKWLILGCPKLSCLLKATLPLRAHPLAPVHVAAHSYCIAEARTGRLAQLLHT